MVAEGVQVLEHACLVRSVLRQGAGGAVGWSVDWTITRLGRAALAQNAGERILGGGNLQRSSAPPVSALDRAGEPKSDRERVAACPTESGR